MENLLIRRGRLLRSLLDANNMQVKELAEEMCVSSQAVTNWLQGKNEIASDKIIDLCGIFGITADEFLKAELKEVDNKNKRGPLKRFVTQLTDLEKFNIIEDFTSGLSKNEIILKYNLELGSSSIREAIGSVQVQNECPNCGEKLFLKIVAKRKFLFCNNCEHSDKKTCKCNYCLAKKEQAKIAELNRSKQLLIENINSPEFEPDYDKEVPFTFFAIRKILKYFPNSKNTKEILSEKYACSGLIEKICVYLFYKGYLSISKEHIDDIFKIDDDKIDVKSSHKNVARNSYCHDVKYKINIDLDKFLNAFEARKEELYASLLQEAKIRIRDSFLHYFVGETSRYRLYSSGFYSKEVEKLDLYFEKYSYSNFCRNIDWYLKKDRDIIKGLDKEDKKYYVKHLLENMFNIFDNVEKKGKALFEKSKLSINYDLEKFMNFSNAKGEILFTPFSKIDSTLFDI